MLLLHQSALKYKNIMNQFKDIFVKNNNFLYIASEGIEPSYVMTKTLCLNHLTIRPKDYFF